MWSVSNCSHCNRHPVVSHYCFNFQSLKLSEQLCLGIILNQLSRPFPRSEVFIFLSLSFKSYSHILNSRSLQSIAHAILQCTCIKIYFYCLFEKLIFRDSERYEERHISRLKWPQQQGPSQSSVRSQGSHRLAGVFVQVPTGIHSLRGRDPLTGSSPPAFLGAVARAGSGAVEEVRTAVLA